MQCVHLCIFDSEHLKCILVAVCHLSDTDSEDEFIHPALDDDDPSERCGGQSRRRDELYLSERRAILQDLQQRHSRLTFKTKSVEEAADIFECFGNVSLCVLFFGIFCIQMHIFNVLLHILHITSDQCFSPLLRQRMCHIVPYPLCQKIYCRQ